MQILILLLTVFVTFFSVYGVLKLVFEPMQTESLKRKAYIRTLEHNKDLIDSGINPSNHQAFGQDHSHDLCNAYNPCSGCKKVEDKNMALNKAAWAKYNATHSV